MKRDKRVPSKAREKNRSWDAWDREEATFNRLAKEDIFELMKMGLTDLWWGRKALVKVIESDLASPAIVAGAKEAFLGQTDAVLYHVKRLANAGDQDALGLVWRLATELALQIDDIARTRPDRLRDFAPYSLFMPSLRAKSAKHMTDFLVIAKRIGLSDQCAVYFDGKRAQHELHSAATLFVALWIEKVHNIAREAEWYVRRWERLQKNADSDDEYYEDRDLTLESFLRDRAGFSELELRYCTLPYLHRGTCDRWWKEGLKPYIDTGGALEHIHDTRFYSELVKATDNGKEYELRDEMKRRCKPKLRSLAKPTVDLSVAPPTVWQIQRLLDSST